MNTQRFAPRDTLELRQADRDVAIRGWDEEEIKLVLDGDLDQCDIEQQETTLVLTAHVPVAIHVPRGTDVSAGTVSDDLLLRDLDGAVQIGTAHGDVSIRSGQASATLNEVHGDLAVEGLKGPLSVGLAHSDVHLGQMGTVTLGRVHGGVNARTVAGELQMGAVSGDVRARDVGGPLTLEEGQGSFTARDLAGGMNVHSVQGDLSLKTALTPGLTYSGQAQGSISARFPEGTSARFDLQAKGRLSARGLAVETNENGHMAAHTGNGEAEVVLRADGDLSVKVQSAEQDPAWGFSMDELSEQINAEIAEHMSKLGDRMPDLGALVSGEIEKAMHEVEREIAKAQRKAEKAARKAQERAQRAQERAQRHAQEAQRRARQFQARFEHRGQTPPDAGFGAHAHAPRGRASRSARPQPSREEQIAVLNMLQEGKISTEEAEVLLKALES
jgi:DUF4097 and DUF4098 domain-containing protein YvlB